MQINTAIRNTKQLEKEWGPSKISLSEELNVDDDYDDALGGNP